MSRRRLPTIGRRSQFGRKLRSGVSGRASIRRDGRSRLGFEALERRTLMAADPGWAFAVGGSVDDDAETRIGPDGSIYAVGAFSGTADFDPGAGVSQLTAQGGSDVFIAKYSPQGALVWAKGIGGNGWDFSNGLEFDPAGDLVVPGQFTSTTLTIGTTTLTNQGNYDTFIAKFDDATGNAMWARGVGGAAHDMPFDVVVNAAGEVYTIGTFRFSLDFDPGPGSTLVTESGNNGAGDAFVWKLDNSGALVWARPFGNEYLDNGHSLALDGSGALYAAGTYRGTVDFGQPGNPLPLSASKVDSADLFLVKMDEATGDAVWARQATGPSHINAARLVADGAGNVYLAGGFMQTVSFGAGTPTLTSAGATDAFLSKWDAAGNFVWADAFAGAGDTLVQSLQVDPAGNPLMTFGFTGTVDFNPGAGVANLASTSGLDGAAVALLADGSLDWVRHMSGPGTTQAEGLVKDSAGNYYLSGTFQTSVSLPTGHTLTRSGNGSFLMKLALGEAPTKFYVVDDASANQTFEYDAAGAAGASSGLTSANSAPRGAASTAAGDRVWVVDANRKVYVYDINGNLVGSWTAGTMASNATPEGIATNGTDVWIVDSKSDKVYKYSGAASRTSGSQNAASSFNLNSGNTSPKDIVTNGASLWVVNDAATDKVFKYTTAGGLQGSWTIDAANSKPTGITIDPANVSDIWIVDNGTDRVYRYAGAATRTSGSQAAADSFALAAGNANPQGIADPPPASTANVIELDRAARRAPVMLADDTIAKPARTTPTVVARQRAFAALSQVSSIESAPPTTMSRAMAHVDGFDPRDAESRDKTSDWTFALDAALAFGVAG